MGIIQNAKEIADLVKTVGDIELYRRIVELEGEIIELTRDVRTKGERIAQLEEAIRNKKQLHYNKPFYYVEEESDPYCAHCWETETLMVHIVYGGHYGAGHKYWCPHCKFET